MAHAQAPQITQPVAFFFNNQKIGSGTADISPGTLSITGSYENPSPLEPGKAQFSFFFQELTNSRCRVAVNWPGILLQEIPKQEAGYSLSSIFPLQVTAVTGDGVRIILGLGFLWWVPWGVKVTVWNGDAVGEATFLDQSS